MDRHSPHQLLRAPEPTRDALDFCEATGSAVRLWIASLPKANLGETSRQLYAALGQLNELRIAPAQRIELLELLRPAAHETCLNLEQQFLAHSTLLDHQARRIASLCQALHTHLATGYKRAVIDLIENGLSTASTASFNLALQRAVHSLYAALIPATQMYSPVPEGAWLELHLLFEIARMHNLERVAVADALAGVRGSLSVEQSYLAALLLGCARCNQLRARSIRQLGSMLESWSALARLQSATEPSSLFVVTPPVDGAPRYRSLVPPATLPGWLGIDANALTDAIKVHLQTAADRRHQSPLPGADGIDTDLLLHLYSAWGGMATRTFPRTPAEGSLTICIGMSAVHYYLAGQTEFDSLIKHGRGRLRADFDTPQKINDVWAQAFDAQDRIRRERKLERIDFRNVSLDTEADAPKDAAFPLLELSIVDQSPEGYCLEVTGEGSAQLQVGELVAIRTSAEPKWTPAAIRWMRQPSNGNLQLGIQLIAREAQPCALRLLGSERQSSQYLRALLLPEGTSTRQPATLIVPRMPFKQGQKVGILNNQSEYRALLTHRQSGTPSFNQFEYQSLEMQELALEDQAVPFTSGARQNAEEGEGFDSLWKSL